MIALTGHEIAHILALANPYTRQRELDGPDETTPLQVQADILNELEDDSDNIGYEEAYAIYGGIWEGRSEPESESKDTESPEPTPDSGLMRTSGVGDKSLFRCSRSAVRAMLPIFVAIATVSLPQRAHAGEVATVPNVQTVLSGLSEKAPADAVLKDAVVILTRKLDDWESVSDAETLALIDGVGRHKFAPARDVLTKCLRYEPSKHESKLITAYALFALSHIGDADVVPMIINAADGYDERLLETVAVVLGEFVTNDSRESLERLAGSPWPGVRSTAISALSKQCSPSSRTLVLGALNDEFGDTRRAATWWLVSCGEPEDDQLLVERLHDDDELIRANAIEGLLRMQSSIACSELDRLRSDSSMTVRGKALEYTVVCER